MGLENITGTAARQRPASVGGGPLMVVVVIGMRMRLLKYTFKLAHASAP